MKRLFSLILIFILCFTFVACGESEILLSSVVEKKDIDFDARLSDTVISYEGRTYRYNNGFESFTAQMMNFLKTCQVTASENFADTENQISISFWDINNAYIYVYVNEADQLKVCDDAEIDENYTCSGIYEKVLAYIQPICEETDKYYKLEQPVNVQTSSYEIYNKNGNVLEQDAADRNPHLSRISDDIICLWIQEGTGASGIINTFYNWETGAISKSYTGYTDVYDGYLCCGGYNKVEISRLFDDEILYTVEEFSKPFSDMEDSIISAYFSDDGTQLLVQYVDENYEIVDEAIDIPKDVMKLE